MTAQPRSRVFLWVLLGGGAFFLFLVGIFALVYFSVRSQKKKRIVASIETVGASGAYYVSSATNKIFADDASIVGSIGVIAQWVNYEELMKWAKLKDITLKAGEFKDTGSPTRDMTPAERAYMQGIIDDMHVQFIHSVASGRHLKD